MVEAKVDAKELHVMTGRVQRELEQIGSSARKIARYQQRQIQRNFDLERSPKGTPWQKLKPATLKQKKGAGILKESNDLRNSIEAIINGLTVTIQSRLIYSETQQRGDPSRGIPAREYIGVSKQDEKEITDILRTEVKKLLKKYK